MNVEVVIKVDCHHGRHRRRHHCRHRRHRRCRHRRRSSSSLVTINIIGKMST